MAKTMHRVFYGLKECAMENALMLKRVKDYKRESSKVEMELEATLFYFFT